jgi:hypothetical protein
MRQDYLISTNDSSGLWAFHPGRSITEGRQALRSSLRSLSGELYGYSWGTHFRASLPITFAESGLRAALAHWWRVQSRLAWIQIGSGGPVTALVRIGNRQDPLGRRHVPDGALFAGLLLLEGIGREADRVRGAPLILDHATFGTLGTFNTLV